MRCPICSNQLKQIKYKAIVLDQCSKCKGVWFDSGELLELARIIKGQGRIIDPQEPEELPKIDSPSSVEEKKKLCPKCQCKLTRFNYSYDSNIFLDKCSNCDGIWADKGETKQVARYLQSVTKAKAVKRQFREAAMAEKHAVETRKVDKEAKKIIAKNWDDPRIR